MKSIGQPVFISDEQSKALTPLRIGDAAPFDERWLQELVFKHPEAIPITQVEPGLGTLIPVCLELPLRSGFLDNLYVTADGDLVLVEVKLWKNHEMRRAVLAQALDYASAVFSLSYDELDEKVKKAEASEGKSLYEIAQSFEALDERDFIDAVSHNLRTGRIVVLVVGDGIRSELEKLYEGLQQHSGFQFTFGLIELSIYEPTDGEYLLVPRTLAVTHRVERGVIRIEGHSENVRMEPVQSIARADANQAKSISSDLFFEAMAGIDPSLPAKLASLLTELEAFGVYPEFKRSLILRWEAPEGQVVNLGYIQRNGQVWTDQVESSSPNLQAARAYLENLARGLDASIGEISGRPYIQKNGRAIRIEHALGSAKVWKDAVTKFVNCF